MSVLIALKFKDGVILASDKQVTYGNIKNDNATKIFKSKYSKTAMGIAGCCRTLDLIFANTEELMDYKDILDNVTLDYKYVVNIIVTDMFKILDKYGCLYRENNIVDTYGEYIVISEDKIFQIFSNGAVIESELFASIGCGVQLVKGYLDGINYNYKQTTESEARHILEICIKQCCKDDVFINSKIDYIVLKKEDN